MSKRSKIREWLLEQENGITFTIWEASKKVGVDIKDVSNIILSKKLVEAGALTKRNDKARKCNVYNIFDRKKLKEALKLKLTRVKPEDTAAVTVDDVISGTIPKSTPGEVKIADRVRKSPRSPFVMALDKEIKDLNDKIKLLQAVRKGFV